MEEKKTSILVVDDEPDVVCVLRNFLARKGYNVSGASSGEKALELLEKEKADLVLLDIVMPGLQGTEVAKIVRQKYPHTKIVVATAFPRESDQLNEEAMMQAMVTKPFRLNELLQKLEEVLTQEATRKPKTCEEEEDEETETRLLFVKAKLLVFEPLLETYDFLYRQFKELLSRGQLYELDLAQDEKEMFRKVKYFEPDIVIFDKVYLDKMDSGVPAKVLLASNKICEVISFDLAATIHDSKELEKLTKQVRLLSIRNGLIEIK